jgi:hypothetical protein
MVGPTDVIRYAELTSRNFKSGSVSWIPYQNFIFCFVVIWKAPVEYVR